MDTTGYLNKSRDVDDAGSFEDMIKLQTLNGSAAKYPGSIARDPLRSKTPASKGTNPSGRHYSLLSDISHFDRFIKAQNKTLEQIPFDNSGKPDPYLEKLSKIATKTGIPGSIQFSVNSYRDQEGNLHDYVMGKGMNMQK